MPSQPGDNTRPVMLTADAARRIGRAVQAYEQGHPQMRGKLLRTAAGDGGDELRLGTVSGSWLKGATATVTRLNGDGSAWSPQQTFEAINHFADISIDCGSRTVACARIGSTWILIAAECSTAGS